ncbi:ATP-dependent DNA helicase [Bacillus aquiflavi]|uniref:ATP-dependent DNA helicase n=1 Tax=Bacillus aquiflavi TaxID=2672567 RepID=UPI001CA7E4FE|nr:ATP-dependent DNA helicase [Bacillus aquiflavi]UAC47031.1 ATP-dependent DNA helicase [Bacillus aquiflavi]
MQNRLPFPLSKTESFFDKLSEWIGDVFYEWLPEAGLELRDEQIYIAFQLEKAFKEKKVMFAEAGVGTGKTIVYLLYAICYARYTHKPAIIACADETLIEQLVKKQGDVAKLEQILQLNIDVRLAKSRDQYLCLKKLDHAVASHDTTLISKIYNELPEFIHGGGSMQIFKPYGDRKDYPEINDFTWKQISWDSLQDCFTCEKRHRCGQTLHRDYYRNGQDLIICSHDFYMEHIWTKEARKREGQLPLLPNGSCVVFDEGHLLEYAAQKALTYRITEQTIETLLTRLLTNDVREKTLHLIEKAIDVNKAFFMEVITVSSSAMGSDKKEIDLNSSEKLIQVGNSLLTILQLIEEELVFEAELYIMNEYDLKVVEEHIDQMTYSLSLLLKNRQAITWLEEHNDDRTIVIMPRLVEEILQEEVFSEKKPFIFSSATLSENKSFAYIANSLGITDYLSFSVQSPFDYNNKMKLQLPMFNQEDHFKKKAHYVLQAINESDGGALVLFTNREDLFAFKKFVNSYSYTKYPIYYEGDGEISTLVDLFQNDVQSVLCSVHLWEGLDIPGRSLRNVIIFSLPFPPSDPVFTAKREAAATPFLQVDMPYMLLRLRQGIGRLIRTHEDEGTIHILLEDYDDHEVISKVKSVLPVSI